VETAKLDFSKKEISRMPMKSAVSSPLLLEDIEGLFDEVTEERNSISDIRSVFERKK